MLVHNGELVAVDPSTAIRWRRVADPRRRSHLPESSHGRSRGELAVFEVGRVQRLKLANYTYPVADWH